MTRHFHSSLGTSAIVVCVLVVALSGVGRSQSVTALTPKVFSASVSPLQGTSIIPLRWLITSYTLPPSTITCMPSMPFPDANSGKLPRPDRSTTRPLC